MDLGRNPSQETLAMDAIETLMNEHRNIERAIDALVAFAAQARRGRTDDERERLGRFVEFIREYADRQHHGKEEDILFAAMVEVGFPRQGGPIAVMLHEHDTGRALVAELAGLARPGAPWSDEDRVRLADAAIGYGNLLRSHIHKEDAILYPMAEQRLPEAVARRVDEACERFDAERRARGEAQRLEALAAQLAPAGEPAHP
jgi:hemerythrin-like domain-containing protein